MKNLFKFVIRDIKKNFISVSFFMVQIVIIGFYLFISIDSTLFSYNIASAAKKIEDKNITYFNKYTFAQDYEFTQKNIKFLRSVFNNKQAYTYINDSVIKGDTVYPVLIILGNFNEVYNVTTDYIGNEETVAYVGKNSTAFSVNDQIPVKDLGMNFINQDSILVKGILNKKASYFNGTYLETLDDQIIIFTTPKALFGNRVGSATAIWNICFTDISYQDLVEVIDNLNSFKKFEYQPKSLNESLKEIKVNSTYSISFFFYFFSCTIVFSILGFFTSIINMINKNMREYSICRLYGASNMDIYLRIFTYLFLIVFVPVTTSFIFFRNIFRVTYIPVFVIPLLIFVLIIIIFIIPAKKIRDTEISYCLRSDNLE